MRTRLSEGGDANLRNRFGWSLLMVAALYGRTDVVKDAGVNARPTNDFETAASLARLKGHNRTANVIERAMRDGV